MMSRPAFDYVSNALDELMPDWRRLQGSGNVGQAAAAAIRSLSRPALSHAAPGSDAQAPKPVSAGGEHTVDSLLSAISDCVDKVYNERAKEIILYRSRVIAAEAASAGGELTCWHCGAGAMPEHFKFCYLCGHAIAAEADTANHLHCKPHGRIRCGTCALNADAADRLAPIEARGTVTDAEVERALDIWCNKPVTDDTNLPKSLRDRSRAVLEAFLRARESAPAVELPPIEANGLYKDRFYIPLPGGWEIQTKGSGSSFRICNTKTNERWNISPQPYLYEMLEQMAREVHATWNEGVKK